MRRSERVARRQSAGAFTLLEILVAAAVLGLILLGISQMMNSAMDVTIGDSKHMDADTQARLVLDRLAYDVSKMVKRTDVDYYFNNSTSAPHNGYGSDLMTFYSESSGYYPVGSGNSNLESPVSLVGYRIAPNVTTGVYQLERLSKGLVWNGAGNGTYYPLVFLPSTLTSTWAFLDTNSEDADYQIIGDQIFCMKISYLLQTSSTSVQVYNTPNTSGIAAGQLGYFNPIQVQAIIVTIAVLDSNSQKTLANPASQLQAAASELSEVLPAPTTAPITSTTPPLSPLPLTQWQAKLKAEMSNGGYLKLGKAAAAQLRFYQRYIYLTQSLQ